MRKLIAAAVLLASVSMPAMAQAKGFYGSLSIGGVSVNDVNTTIFAPAGEIIAPESEGEGEFALAASIPAGSDTVSGKYDLKTSAIVSGSLGYDWGMFRTDLEVSYARSRVRAFTVGEINGSPVTLSEADAEDICFYSEIDDCSVSGNRVAFGGGPKLRQLNAMANVWVDIPLGGELGLEPYVGGGLGVAGFELEGEGKAKFAWQVGGGLAYKLSPAFAITADLRYREADGATINDAGYGFAIDKIKSFSYGLGLRATF